MLHHPCILRGKRTKSKRAQKRAEMQNHPCILGGPQQKATNSKRAQKRAEMLHDPCILKNPQKRGQKQKRAQKHAEMLHHPCIRESPTKGTKSKRAQKRGETVHHPCIRSPTKGKKQGGPKSGRKCYLTPAFSVVPNKGDKIKAGPKEGGNATSPLYSRGSRPKGTKSKRAKEGSNTTSPLHTWGFPKWGTKSKRAQKRAEMLHHPCILKEPQQRGQNQSGAK